MNLSMHTGWRRRRSAAADDPLSDSVDRDRADWAHRLLL